jgi:hypothetical protein
MKLYTLFATHGINLTHTEDISGHFISQVWNSMYLTHEVNVCHLLLHVTTCENMLLSWQQCIWSVVIQLLECNHQRQFVSDDFRLFCCWSKLEQIM